MRSLNVRGLWLVVMHAAAVIGVGAQSLDLSGPRVPEPGEGRVALSIATRLLDEARSTEPEMSRDRAARSFREIAARAIREGESRGIDGARHVVFGMTLAAALRDADARLESLDELEAVFVAADLAAIAASVPEDSLALEMTFRDAVSLLYRTEGRAEEPSRDAATLQRLIDAGVPEIQLEVFREAQSAAREAASWPTLEPSVRRLVTLLGSIAAFEPSDPAYGRARASRLAEALTLSDATDRDALLRAIVLDDRLAAAADRFPRDATAVRERERLLSGLTERHPLRAEVRVARAIELLSSAEQLDALPNERTLAPPLRPAYRALLPEARTAGVRGRAAAIDLATRANAKTDPATLAAARIATETASLFREYLALNGAITGDFGRIEPRYDPIAQRVLAIGRDALGGDREGAEDLIRRLLEDRALSVALGESLPGAIRVLRESRAPTVVQRVNTARAAWTNAWSIPGSQGVSDRDRVEGRALLRLLEVLCDLDAAGDAELQREPWWHVTEDARVAIRDGVDDRIERVLRRTLDRDSSMARLGAELDAFEGEFAVVLLAGRATRTLAAAPEDGGPAGDGLLFEIATGPRDPNDPAFALLDGLTRVCRYANELPGREPPEGLRAYLASIALPLRDRLAATD